MHALGHEQSKRRGVEAHVADLLQAKGGHPAAGRHDRQAPVVLEHRGWPLVERCRAAVSRLSFRESAVAHRDHPPLPLNR